MEKVYFKQDPKSRSFEYDKFARALTYACNKTVKNEMGGLIVLNFAEIETLVLAFPDENAWYQKNAEKLDNCLNEASHHKVGCITFSAEDVQYLVNYLDITADSSDYIKLMNTIIHWYGVKRQSVRLDKEFIPQDVGRGHFDDTEYCGTTIKEFVFENVSCEEEDIELIEF